MGNVILLPQTDYTAGDLNLDYNAGRKDTNIASNIALQFYIGTNDKYKLLLNIPDLVGNITMTIYNDITGEMEEQVILYVDYGQLPAVSTRFKVDICNSVMTATDLNKNLLLFTYQNDYINFCDSVKITTANNNITYSTNTIGKTENPNCGTSSSATSGSGGTSGSTSGSTSIPADNTVLIITIVAIVIVVLIAVGGVTTYFVVRNINRKNQRLARQIRSKQAK